MDRPAERQWIDPASVVAALDQAPHLSDEQREAVHRAANLDGISVIEAGAGTGKTTAARAISDAAWGSGLKVVGIAPSWVAADELSSSVGIDAQAIAKWRYDHEHGRAPQLDDKTLLIVDEAGMASMRDMAAIVIATERAGAKLVLLGDSRQLQSVPGGSALRAITEVVRQNAVMEAVRRQAIEWQRAASMMMARGDAEAGLRAYAREGRVETVSGADAAMNRVVERWRELRATHGDDVLVITRRNADASIPNALIRSALRSQGRLPDGDVALPSIDRERNRVSLNLAPGDIVRFGDNLPDLGIRNGSRGTVQSIHFDQSEQSTIRFRLADGREVEQPWQTFARNDLATGTNQPRIVHAYAGTAYSVQGRTAAASVHYVGAATDAREVYVALTRHRHDVRLVVERDRIDAACRQRQADPRIPATSTAIEECLLAEASQYSEKANVVDYVADRRRFIATGSVTSAEQRFDRRALKLLETSRSLREALASLRSRNSLMPLWRLVEGGRRLLPPIKRSLTDVIRQVQKERGRRRTFGRDVLIDR